ncbi:MAG: hypothetical protein EON58_15145 [Alphaproteobacteria bacterium]|nr:MAG: hypothetical protein EON58_15145 [Alphaproteobacteria bacterium]
MNSPRYTVGILIVFVLLPFVSVATDDLQRQEKLRQLEAIRVARAEAQLQLEGAELRLFELSLARGEITVWVNAITSKVKGKWVRPPIEETGTSPCRAHVLLAETGDVTGIEFKERCSTPSLERSVAVAIIKSSQLPLPTDPSVFKRRLILSFQPKDEA